MIYQHMLTVSIDDLQEGISEVLIFLIPESESDINILVIVPLILLSLPY